MDCRMDTTAAFWETVLHLLYAFHLPLSSLYAAMLYSEEALFH